MTVPQVPEPEHSHDHGTADLTTVVDAIPMPPSATPVGSQEVDGAVALAQYELVGTSVDEIAAYYARVLPAAGWEEAATEPRSAPTGGEVWAGGWSRDGFTLSITASSSTTGSADDSVLSVSLDRSVPSGQCSGEDVYPTDARSDV